MKTHGIWWNIAGAGWVSCLPNHHNQFEMFGGCPKGNHNHHPYWSSNNQDALTFTKEEAIALAKEWSLLGNGPYEARPIHENI